MILKFDKLALCHTFFSLSPTHEVGSSEPSEPHFAFFRSCFIIIDGHIEVYLVMDESVPGMYSKTIGRIEHSVKLCQLESFH